MKAAGVFDRSIVSNIEDTILPSKPDPKTATETTTGTPDLGGQNGDDFDGNIVSSILDDDANQAALRAAVIAEIDRLEDALPRKDFGNVLAALPTTPETAVLPERLATTTALTVDEVVAVLEAPWAQSIQKPRGRFSDTVWFKDQPRFLRE